MLENLIENLIEKFILYWQFPFVRYAFITGIMISICASLLGVTLVLKRFSFIGDGLSHAAFGALAAAAAMNIGFNMPVVLVVTILCAVMLLRTGANASIKGDAAVAMLSAGSLAGGYMLMNIFSSSSNLSGDVCTTLFGSVSILTLTVKEVWLCAVLSISVVLAFILFYNKIFAVTFDEDFAASSGVNTQLCNLLTAVMSAAVIVLAMKLAGSLLVSALIVFPALSAMRIFKSFRAVIIFSVIISVICAAIGIIISVLAGTPVGSTIVIADILAFGICYIAGKILYSGR